MDREPCSCDNNVLKNVKPRLRKAVLKKWGQRKNKTLRVSFPGDLYDVGTSMLEDESCQCDLTITNETEDTHEDTIDIELPVEESRMRKNVKNYNKTFSENVIREIERTNNILMNKILSNSVRQSQYPAVNIPVIRNTSNSINRRRRQQEIDRNNLLLLKRIQSVKPFGLSRRDN
ncbi:hypothetical protein Trydic_g20703 [Trypoxylus dichotomus]